MREPHQEPEWIFRQDWIQCSNRGQCDALDGAEYRRVLAEWLAAGQPVLITAFIRRRANIDSNGGERNV